MASPAPHSAGYSGPTNPSLPETPSSQPKKSHIPPPLVPPGDPRFHTPKFQQDQVPSPSTKMSNVISPANGMKTGSHAPHLSTPSGPPVFASPIRPTVVPFRSSPVTPQQVPFSSSSSLPTSSPPHFSNGSAELHYQATNVTEDTLHTGEAPYVLFSANKVFSFFSGVQASIPSLGFGALISSGREISPGPQIIQPDPHYCTGCGAYPNVYCKILLGSGQWQCAISWKLNQCNGEYVAPSRDDLRNFPSSTMVDYVQTRNRRPPFIPVSDSRMSAPIVLVIDECLDEPHLWHLQGSLHAFVDSLSPTTRIGIILYGRTVSVYDFSEESTTSADVLPGDKSPTQESLKGMIYGTGLYFSPMYASLPVAHAVFSSLRPYKLNIPEASRDRCLGTAVKVALAIIKGPSEAMSQGVIKRFGGNNRIIKCADGPNTFGPGSVPHSFSHPNYPYLEKTTIKWMENLGREVHGHDTVVDILCTGTCPVRVPVLQPLAKVSGGVLVLNDDFGEAFGVNLQRESTRAADSHGLLEIRWSDYILITQVVGPREEAHVDTNETFKNDTSLYIQIPIDVYRFTQSVLTSQKNLISVTKSIVYISYRRFYVFVSNFYFNYF